MKLKKENFFRLGDGSHIYYEVHGEGVPLVLLHGIALSGKVFHKNAAELAKKYKVIVPDFRGHGYSTKELTGHTVEQYARDIHALLQFLGVQKFVLSGWSISVTVALAYIDLFGQENLLGVALIDGSCTPFSEEPWNAHKLSGYNMEGLIEKYSHMIQDPEGTAQNSAEGWIKDKEGCKEEIQLLIREQAKTPVWISYAIYTNYMMYDNAHVLGALEVPVLVIVPEYNKLRGEYEASLAQNSEMHMIDAAHAMFLEQPEKFNQILISFMDRVLSSTDKLGE